MEMARKKLDQEINIIEIVKSWRYFEQALRYLLPQRKRLDFKETTRYITIDPELNEEEKRRKEFVQLAKRSASLRRAEFSDGFFSSQDDAQPVTEEAKAYTIKPGTSKVESRQSPIKLDHESFKSDESLRNLDFEETDRQVKSAMLT